MKTLSALLFLCLFIASCGGGDMRELYDLTIEEEKAKSWNDDVTEFRFPDMPDGEVVVEKGNDGAEVQTLDGGDVEINILTTGDGKRSGLTSIEYIAVEDGKEKKEKAFGIYEEVDGEWVEPPKKAK